MVRSQRAAAVISCQTAATAAANLLLGAAVLDRQPHDPLSLLLFGF